MREWERRGRQAERTAGGRQDMNWAIMAGVGENEEPQKVRFMTRTFDDDNEDDPGPVVVRRPVYEAAKKFEANLKRRKTVRDPAFVMAEKKADDFKAEGKTDEAAFWFEVHNYLMSRESVGAKVKTVVLEEGERYDFESGKVIRS